MNFQLSNFTPTSTLTMNSREIAMLTGKAHSHVMRDIRTMMADLEQNPNLDSVCKSSTYTGSNGQSYDQYELDKDTCLTLLLGYDAVARMKVVKRWQELEAQVKPAFALPQTFAQALALAAQQALELEQKQLQLEAAKPKVDYVNNYVDRNNLKSVTEVAKELGTSGKVLCKWLRDNEHMWKRTDKQLWKQTFIDKGYGEMKQYTSAGGFDGTQALVTASGDLFIKQNFSK